MSSFEKKSQELISKVTQNPLLLNFWEHSYTMDNLILPQNYPTLDDIFAFQDGYAYNVVTEKSLVGEKGGNFKESWLVIASNYFSDPFFIDFTEIAENFPVYFAYHGAGKWEPIKVSHSIDQFNETLRTIFEYAADNTQCTALLKELACKENEFWIEVYENELSNSDTSEEQEVEIKDDDWREVALYITTVGPNKMKVISLLKGKFNLSATEALAMSKSSRIFYAKGAFKFMKASMQQLENLKVSFEVVEL
ncbi:hypothetical protein D3C87_666110 [compost metagenome]